MLRGVAREECLKEGRGQQSKERKGKVPPKAALRSHFHRHADASQHGRSAARRRRHCFLRSSCCCCCALLHCLSMRSANSSTAMGECEGAAAPPSRRGLQCRAAFVVCVCPATGASICLRSCRLLHLRWSSSLLPHAIETTTQRCTAASKLSRERQVRQCNADALPHGRMGTSLPTSADNGSMESSSAVSGCDAASFLSMRH